MSVTWETTKARHGTTSGWALHQRLGERPCDPCLTAKLAYNRRRLETTPEAVQAHRLVDRAAGRAMRELRRRHRDEYVELYAQAKADLAAETEGKS